MPPAHRTRRHLRAQQPLLPQVPTATAPPAIETKNKNPQKSKKTTASQSPHQQTNKLIFVNTCLDASLNCQLLLYWAQTGQDSASLLGFRRMEIEPTPTTHLDESRGKRAPCFSKPIAPPFLESMPPWWRPRLIFPPAFLTL